MKILLFIILSIFIRFSHAQNLSHEYLTNLEDEELLSLFNRYRGDSTQAERVARIYLNRARREGDTIKMARGYDRLARIFHFKKNLGFCDSIINLTSDLKNKTYPALGYMIKSFEYSKKGDLVNSFKNILIVYNLSIQNDNISHELYALNALIKSKSYWGNSREALDLQNHRHELLQRPDIHDLLIGSSRIGYQEKTKELMAENEINSFLGFVICYLNLQDFKKSEMYIDSLRTKILEYRGYNRNKYIRWPAECLLELEFRRNNLKRYLEISDA
ncbi:MAG: hypothetical protein KJO12_08345, partial [Ignavibacteria bacterium]|nr:hypothetical protein [Ignavibacteria bacterium]